MKKIVMTPREWNRFVSFMFYQLEYADRIPTLVHIYEDGRIAQGEELLSKSNPEFDFEWFIQGLKKYNEDEVLVEDVVAV